MDATKAHQLVDQMFTTGTTVTLWKGAHGYWAKAGFLDSKLTIANTHGDTIRECLTNLAVAWDRINRNTANP